MRLTQIYQKFSSRHHSATRLSWDQHAIMASFMWQANVPMLCVIRIYYTSTAFQKKTLLFDLSVWDYWPRLLLLHVSSVDKMGFVSSLVPGAKLLPRSCRFVWHRKQSDFSLLTSCDPKVEKTYHCELNTIQTTFPIATQWNIWGSQSFVLCPWSKHVKYIFF